MEDRQPGTMGTCATEGCGKPLSHKKAKYCRDCAMARNRAYKAAYSARRNAELKKAGWTRRLPAACPEFYAPLEEILAAGACASAVEVHAALAARMPAGAAVPDVSALRFHCRHRGIALPHRSPADHARHMLAGRLAAKLLPAPDTANETAAKRRARRGGSAPAAPAGGTCPPGLPDASASGAPPCAGEAPALADAFDAAIARLGEALDDLRRLVAGVAPELRRLARIEEALTALGFLVTPRKEV